MTGVFIFLKKGKEWSLDTATHIGRTSCEDKGRDQCDAMSISQRTAQMASKPPETVLQGRANYSSIWICFFNLCFLLLLFTERTLPIQSGLPQKPLPLYLTIKPKCPCSGPCPPVGGRMKEINTSLPEDCHSRRYLQD